MNIEEQELLNNLKNYILTIPNKMREVGVRQTALALICYLMDKYKLEDELIAICKQYIKNND